MNTMVSVGALPSLRSQEEDDLLERSKKKTKTTQEQRKELEEVENVMEETEPSTGKGEQMAEESCPSANPSSGGEEQTPPEKLGVNATGKTNGKEMIGYQGSHARMEPELKEQFGPWMLAVKPPRRGKFSNGKGTGFGKGVSFIGNPILPITSPPKANSSSTKSRFAVLDNEEIEVEEAHVALEEATNISPNNKTPLNSKGKRPVVQINEKQILNDHERNNIRRDTTKTNRESLQGAGETSRRRNQAASQVEHTVVREFEVLEIPIDPLVTTWPDFMEDIDKVVLEHLEDDMRIQLHGGPDERNHYILRRHLVGNKFIFHKIVHISINTALTIEPAPFQNGMENKDTFEVVHFIVHVLDINGLQARPK
nr:uncharacterized protein LOC109162703 [Ipomoea batatas]